MPLCLESGQAVPLTDEGRAALLQRDETLARQALRTLAIATRTMPAAALGVDPQTMAGRAAKVELPESVEEDLVLVGLVGMIDPPRIEAKAAVITAKRAHIRTVMITGDHPATADAIARELTIFEPGTRIITGADLRAMGDAEFDAVVEEVRVFARVDPEHKLRIIRALQRKGHIVAMTGDGINDAPALKSANIGVAMGIAGTDVSKEAAHIVLTDDNFASIVKAIEEGRGIYDNIQKYLLYLLSTNSGELMTMFGGVMFAGMLGLVSAEPGLFLPLLAAQLLWINLVTDGPPALALGVEPKDGDAMKRQPRRHGSGILLTEDWIRLGCVGLLMMVGTLAVLDAYYPGGLFTLFAQGTGPNTADEAHARTMAFTTLMMFQLFDVFNCRSRRRSAFIGFLENRWLLVAIRFSMGAHLLVIYVPFLQTAFHTVPLSIDRLARLPRLFRRLSSSEWSSPKSRCGSCVRIHMSGPPRPVRPGYWPKPRRGSSRPAGAVRHRRQSRPRTPKLVGERALEAARSVPPSNSRLPGRALSSCASRAVWRGRTVPEGMEPLVKPPTK